MINHEPGMRHAPGIKCIVAVPLSASQQATFNMAKQVIGNGLTHGEQIDNGRIVTIIVKLTPMWRCEGCGCSGSMLMDDRYVSWEVAAADGKGELISVWSICSGHAVFNQPHLIPIGDDSLGKDDNVEENKMQGKRADLLIFDDLHNNC